MSGSDFSGSDRSDEVSESFEFDFSGSDIDGRRIRRCIRRLIRCLLRARTRRQVRRCIRRFLRCLQGFDESGS